MQAHSIASMNPPDGPPATMINGLTALGHHAQPADIAAAVAFLAGPDWHRLTGAIVDIDGGFSRCPRGPRFRR